MNMLLWFFGASMILTGFLLLAEGWSDAATEGNGRSGRDDGKEGFRRGMMR
jgi:hypothetical protein